LTHTVTDRHVATDNKGRLKLSSRASQLSSYQCLDRLISSLHHITWRPGDQHLD